eukprot:CAMPEP_0179178270 /NCGR_PEP_ID=MMETSP0796-20121207/88184_1 /TAXON_ID=73915 /ORGANISM="Pyrodinium bahamense, Strain pbaha01" /LENGTH=85 /DNA_ID=CAMNT_0020881857 /DNA_START=17 /DNA_END=270 /DNA_ORIENTATION=+
MAVAAAGTNKRVGARALQPTSEAVGPAALWTAQPLAVAREARSPLLSTPSVPARLNKEIAACGRATEVLVLCAQLLHEFDGVNVA